MKIKIISSNDLASVKVRNKTEISDSATAVQALGAFINVMHEATYSPEVIQKAVDFYANGGIEECVQWDVLQK